MTPEELYDWINSLPGNTMQQKLNLAQDLADAYNVDLFGANEPFVPEQYIPQPGYTGMIWGKDPVMGPIFTAIDNGMSPAEAVRAARENPDLKSYFPAAGQKGDIDFMAVAADYQRELLENQFAEQQFQMQQANKQAIYEGKQPLGAPGETVSMYDVVGRPSLDELMNMYIGGLDQFRDQGRTDLSEFQRQPGAAVEPGPSGGFSVGTNGFRFTVPRPGLPDMPEVTPMNVARGVVGAVGGLGPKVAAGLVPDAISRIRGMFDGGGQEPVSRPVDSDEMRMRQEYARSRIGAEQAKQKRAASKISDPRQKDWEQNLARELAYRSIAGMSNTPVGQTDRDVQAARAFDLLRRYGGG